MKRIISIIILFIIVINLTACSTENNYIFGENISDRLYNLSYIEKDEEIEFTDVDFYNNDEIIISLYDNSKQISGFRYYDINKGELINEKWLESSFYPKIMRLEDDFFALYDTNNFVLFESPKAEPVRSVSFYENLDMNEIDSNESQINKVYTFYSKDKYFYTENAILYSAEFDGKKEMLLDLSDKYDTLWINKINDENLLVQSISFDSYETENLILNIEDKSISSGEEFDDVITYFYDDLTLAQDYYSNNIKVYSSNEDVLNEINIETSNDEEMIIFEDENLIWTHRYTDNIEENICRIYSLEDNSMLYKGNIFAEDKYDYRFGDFSDDKSMAIIGVYEHEEDSEIGEGNIFLFDMSNLSPTNKEESIYNNPEDLKEAITETYNVNIFIKENAMGNFPDFKGEVLNNDNKIMGSLRAIEDVLEKLPNGFIDELCEKVDENSLTKINIYVTGKLESTIEDSIDNAQGYAYSDNELKANCIVLDGSISKYDVEVILEHELMHIIDNKIIQYTNDLDKWDEFLVNGAEYNYSYLGYEGDNNFIIGSEANDDEVCFINSYSKTYPTEDRAEIFKILFYQGEDIPYELNYPIIREKAEFLCKVIRDNFKSVQAVDKAYWERFK